MSKTSNRIGNCCALVLLMNVFAVACSDTGTNADTPDEALPAESEKVSWRSDIAPIVADKCTRCHQEDGIAPFSLQEYATAKPWATAMAAAVEDGRMPPFLAHDTDECKPRLPWYEDLRLSEPEKKLFRDWAKAGAPEGATNAGNHALKLEAQPGAALEREDVVMRLPEPVAVEGSRDIHTCVVVDPGFEKDTYVTGRNVLVGNAKVLHHVVSYIIEPGKAADGSPRTKPQLEAAVREASGVGIGGRYDCFGGPALEGLTTTMLDAWAPGGLPNVAPPNSAQRIAKNALILLDVHYHPTGEREIDADTKLTLMTTDERPEMISQIILAGNTAKEREDYPDGVAQLVKQPGETEAAFVIPADEKDHVEEMSFTFKLPDDLELKVFAVGTHMHYVGRDMRVSLQKVDADADECLIQTPKWDFNWQRGYAYDAKYEELPVIANGDTLKMRCVYDNTLQNSFVARALKDRGMGAPVEVKLGEDTLDEMCIGAIGILYPNSNPN